MKKAMMLLTSTLAVTLFMSCGGSSGSAAVPAEAGGPSEKVGGGSYGNDFGKMSDWTAIEGLPTNYIRLDDIYPSAVPEIKPGFNVDPAGCIFAETADGLLCGNMARPDLSANAREIKATPQIRKLDKTGKPVWERSYDYQTYSGALNNLAVFPDGGFVFSIQTYPYAEDNSLKTEKSCMIRCDKDGKELWRQELEDYSGGLLERLFITENGEAVAVGVWHGKGGRQNSDEADDIVVTKLDRDGKALRQKSFGGSDFESLSAAGYLRGSGVIVSGRTQSGDGPFAIGKDRDRGGFIACIDGALNLQWSVRAAEDEDFAYGQLALSEDSIYILGEFNRRAGASVDGFLVRLDRKGNRVWTKPGIYAGLQGRAVSVLQNGDIAVGAGLRNQGEVIVFDKNGEEKGRLKDLRFVPDRIAPAADGGFIATAVREIKTVPQPPVISSIWYDTELVAVKYKSDYSIEWRKTYDRYRDQKGTDFAFPLKDGRLIVDGPAEDKSDDRNPGSEMKLPELEEHGTVTFRSREGGPGVKLPLFGIAATYGLPSGINTPAAVPSSPPPEFSFRIPKEQQDSLAVFWINLGGNGEYGAFLLGPLGWQPVKAAVGANGSVAVSLENPDDPAEKLTYYDTYGGCQGCAISSIGAYFPSLRKWAEDQFPVTEMEFSRQILLSPGRMTYSRKHADPGYEINGVAYEQHEPGDAWFRMEEMSGAASKHRLATTVLNFFMERYDLE